jgi:hypothetical protein
MTSWYAPLLTIESLGSQSKRATSLADLHERRREHLGQFWTTQALAAFVWRIAEPVIEAARAADGGGYRVGVFDNSVGVGRLLQFCDPEKHILGGVDVHDPSLRRLAETAEAAGFSCEFREGGMEGIRPIGYGVALINPPFSIHLESPLLELYDSNAFGHFGPKTSAISHVYALEQALDAASVVVAIVPRTFADELLAEGRGRLRAVFHAPTGTFSEEGAEVKVSVVVFGGDETGKKPHVETLKSFTGPLLDMDLVCANESDESPRLRAKTLDESEPVVTLPVTGDKKVRVDHDGRRIVLGFGCGLVEAKVLNAIYDSFVPQNGVKAHRYPKGVKYTGQGLLDLEVHLAQTDARASLQSLLTRIKSAGGKPVVAPG